MRLWLINWSEHLRRLSLFSVNNIVWFQHGDLVSGMAPDGWLLGWDELELDTSQRRTGNAGNTKQRLFRIWVRYVWHSTLSINMYVGGEILKEGWWISQLVKYVSLGEPCTFSVSLCFLSVRYTVSCLSDMACLSSRWISMGVLWEAAAWVSRHVEVPRCCATTESTVCRSATRPFQGMASSSPRPTCRAPTSYCGQEVMVSLTEVSHLFTG